MKLRQKATLRRRAAIDKARVLLRAIADGGNGLLENYLTMYGIYLGTNGLAEELKPLFRIPGVSVDSLNLNQETAMAIQRAAVKWLNENPDVPLDKI